MRHPLALIAACCLSAVIAFTGVAWGQTGTDCLYTYKSGHMEWNGNVVDFHANQEYSLGIVSPSTHLNLSATIDCNAPCAVQYRWIINKSGGYEEFFTSGPLDYVPNDGWKAQEYWIVLQTYCGDNFSQIPFSVVVDAVEECVCTTWNEMHAQWCGLLVTDLGMVDLTSCQGLSWTGPPNSDIDIVSKREREISVEGNLLCACSQSPKYTWSVWWQSGVLTTGTGPVVTFVPPDSGDYTVLMQASCGTHSCNYATLHIGVTVFGGIQDSVLTKVEELEDLVSNPDLTVLAQYADSLKLDLLLDEAHVAVGHGAMEDEAVVAIAAPVASGGTVSERLEGTVLLALDIMTYSLETMRDIRHDVALVVAKGVFSSTPDEIARALDNHEAQLVIVGDDGSPFLSEEDRIKLITYWADSPRDDDPEPIRDVSFKVSFRHGFKVKFHYWTKKCDHVKGFVFYIPPFRDW